MSRECAIPMCGFEDEEGEELVLFCGNKHYLHKSCLSSIVCHEYPRGAVCPVCRDESVAQLAMTIVPDLLYMELTPFSQTAAKTASYIGKVEYLRLTSRH